MFHGTLLCLLLHQAPSELAADAPSAPLAPAAPRERRGRGALVTGAVLLPLGLAALVALLTALGEHRRTGVAGDRLYASLDPRTCSASDRALLRRYADTARREEAVIVGLAVAAGLLIPAGAVTLARGLQQRRTRLGLAVVPRFVGLSLTGRF